MHYKIRILQIQNERKLTCGCGGLKDQACRIGVVSVTPVGDLGGNRITIDFDYEYREHKAPRLKKNQIKLKKVMETGYVLKVSLWELQFKKNKIQKFN